MPISSWCLVEMSLYSTMVDYNFLLGGKFHFGTYHFFGEAAFFVGSMFSGSKRWRTFLKLKYQLWNSVCSSSFPVRRVPAMRKDNLWTVGGCEFFLEIFLSGPKLLSQCYQFVRSLLWLLWVFSANLLLDCFSTSS